MFRKYLLFSLFSIFALTLPMQRVETVQAKKTASLEPTQVAIVEAKQVDPRAIILRDYLAKHNSPLQNHAQDFIDAADKYNLDWKLVAAISGVESTFGKATPGNAQYPSYNGWGWGVYGTQALYFTSWRDGIFTVSKGLRENYVNKGLTDPYAMNRVYAASPSWGWKVDYFLKDIEAFAQTYPSYTNPPTRLGNIAPTIAGSSARLALAH